MTRPQEDNAAHERQLKQEEEGLSILSVPSFSGGTSYISGRTSTYDSKRRLSVDSSDEGDSMPKKRRDGSESVQTDGTLKTELKEEPQEGKDAHKRRVVYYKMGIWANRHWHIIGDGRNFQIGFRNRWTDSTLQYSLTLALPDNISAKEDVLDPLPASKDPFWEGSGRKPGPIGNMSKRIANCLLIARALCGHADAPGLIVGGGTM
jgi:hypothetical protein